ncbi:MAG: primosomal protein N' [Zetaproteobacteria bacterium]|nr:primosomal protein N' [Zetaproteobacteria bacterium]
MNSTSDTPMAPYVLQIAIPRPVEHLYSYSSKLPVAQGSRVWVSFGRFKLAGVVWTCTPQMARTTTPKAHFALKPILQVMDTKPRLSASLCKLCEFLSAYYCCPLGEVIRNMLPGQVGTQPTTTIQISAATPPTAVDPLYKLFRGRKQVQEKTLLKALSQRKIDGETWIEREIQALRIIRTWPEVSTLPKSQPSTTDPVHTKLPPLNPSQQACFQAICQEYQRHTPRPVLLFGVTGSGKTRVFMELILDTLKQQATAQALVLIPEIALTPQMTTLFQSLFGCQAVCVHSNLSPKAREQALHQARHGGIRVLIGPRSAIFAPFQNLQLIIVDEEHDSSYKQNNRFAYHGRDCAVMRGKLEQVPVLLSSATPSLESLHNSQLGKYLLTRLTKRAGNASLPHIHLLCAPTQIPSTAEELPHLESPLHPKIYRALQETVGRGEQAMVLVGRRGYANYLFDPKAREPVQCIHCDLSLTFHLKSQKLSCHHCNYHMPLHALRAAHPQKKYVMIGQGTQRIEEMLKAHIPQAEVARLDSDTAQSKAHFFDTLEKFRQKKIHILVGTQMIAKGHDFEDVTTSVLVLPDALLHLPDFRAGEHTFQLMLQASGRAGRKHKKGQVFLQCLDPEHPIFQYLTQHDFLSFAKEELAHRYTHGFPPYRKHALLRYECKNQQLLNTVSQQLKHWLHQSWQQLSEEAQQTLSLSGPVTRSIQRKAGHYGMQILIAADKADRLFRWVQQISEILKRYEPKIRFQAEIDPLDYS